MYCSGSIPCARKISSSDRSASFSKLFNSAGSWWSSASLMVFSSSTPSSDPRAENSSSSFPSAEDEVGDGGARGGSSGICFSVDWGSSGSASRRSVCSSEAIIEVYCSVLLSREESCFCRSIFSVSAVLSDCLYSTIWPTRFQNFCTWRAMEFAMRLSFVCASFFFRSSAWSFSSWTRTISFENFFAFVIFHFRSSRRSFESQTISSSR
mmetsp:Transcript_12788/g.33837  ORF Transcript_12788/g.33837 Transcript_12788/m.33837 type:complete len:209 (-) Transcript_12788:207-833(-)